MPRLESNSGGTDVQGYTGPRFDPVRAAQVREHAALVEKWSDAARAGAAAARRGKYKALPKSSGKRSAAYSAHNVAVAGARGMTVYAKQAQRELKRARSHHDRAMATAKLKFALRQQRKYLRTADK